MTGCLEFRLLDVLEVRRDGSPLGVKTRKLRELLAVLLLAGEASVSVDQIEAALWPNRPPKDPVASIHVYISQLRTALGDTDHSVIERTATGYRLLADPKAVDVHVFDELVGHGLSSLRSGRPEETLRILDEALSMIKGEPLPDFTTWDFARVHIDYIQQRRRSALEARLEARLALGAHGQVIAEARRLLNEDPFDEAVWACLMRALYQSKRRTEALRTFQIALGKLAEAGLEPTAALVDLEGQIFSQDPSLLPTPPAPPSNLPLLTDGTSYTEGMAQILQDLRSAAVLSLVGPASPARSAAIEAGRRSLSDFADGAWLVDLNDEAGDQLLSRAVLDVLNIIPGAEPRQTLTDYLGSHSILLLITGVSGVLDEVKWLADVVEAEPRGSKLVITTETFAIADATPGATRNLEVSTDTADPPPTGSDLEILLSRMRVFSGPASLDAIRSIAGFAPIEAADVDYLLGQLVADEKVALDTAVQLTRFRAIGTADRTEPDAETGRRYLVYCLRLAQRVLNGLGGPGQRDVLALMEAEHQELKAAIAVCLENGRLDQAVRLGRAAGLYWTHQGSFLGQSVTVLAPLADRVNQPSADASGLCLALGFAHFRSGAYPDASNCYDRAIQIALRVNDLTSAGNAFTERCHLRMFLGNRIGAVADLGEARRTAEQIRSPALRARTLMLAAQLDIRSPEPPSGIDHVEKLAEAVRIYKRLGHRSGLANSLLVKASWHINAGEVAAAIESSDKALEIAQVDDDRSMLAFALARSAEALFSAGERDLARTRAYESVRAAVTTGNWLVAALALMTVGLSVSPQSSSDERQALDAFVALRGVLGVPLTGRESAWIAAAPAEAISDRSIDEDEAKSIARRLAIAADPA